MKITKRQLRRIIRESISNIMAEKKFSQLPEYEKYKEVDVYDDLMDPSNVELRDEIFDLIDQSYAYLGGNVDIQKPDDLMDPLQNDYDPFLAWDIDQDPEPDVVRGCKSKSGSMKLCMSANDGSPEALELSKSDTIDRLTPEIGEDHWAEMSGKSASMAMKSGVPAITDEINAFNVVKKADMVWHGEHPWFKDPTNPIYKNLEIEAKKSKSRAREPGQYDGWYERKLGKDIHVKMVFSSSDLG